MTGSTGISVGRPTSARSRWVGRSTLLPGHPYAPPAVKYIAITSSFFGLQLIWAAEMAQASPFLLSLGVSKSMMAVVFVAGPLSGLLAQPLVGVLSDSCRSKFGRRRPFIFAGVIISSLSIALLAWAKTVAGWFAQDGGSAHQRVAIGFAILAVYLVDFSVNVVQAMDRALIVDVVPPAEQAGANAWAARMFGFGAVFGYGLGTLDLVRWSGGYLGDTQLKVIAVFTVALVCVTHAITISCVEERVLISQGDDDDADTKGHPAIRAVKDVWHTLRTIPKPIQSVFNVQFTSWLGWFPVLFFTTTWIAEIYVTTLRPTAYSDLADAPTPIQEEATRAGTTAMFYHSAVALVTSICVPPLVAPTFRVPSASSINTHPYGPLSPSDGIATRIKRLFPISWLTLPLLWTFSTALFGSLLLLCSVIGSVQGATVAVALIGFCWACTNWIPFAVLADLILRVEAPATASKAFGARPLRHADGVESIMLHSSRARSSRKTNTSQPTSTFHTIGPESDESDDESVDAGKGRIIDLDRTPRAASSFVPPPAAASPSASPHFSDETFQDLPPTPATGTSIFSDSTAYFDLPSPALSETSDRSPTLSTPPLNQYSPSRRANSLSPLESPEPVRRAPARNQQQSSRRNPNRYSVASSAATFEDYYPPNNGDTTYDFTSSAVVEVEVHDDDDDHADNNEVAAGRRLGRSSSPRSAGSSGSSRGSVIERNSMSTSSRPGDRDVHQGGDGLGTWAVVQRQQLREGGVGAGASTSTIKLALDPVGSGTTTTTTSHAIDGYDLAAAATAERQGRRTVRVRHSDDLSSLASSRPDHDRFELSDDDDERTDDGDDQGNRNDRRKTRLVPRIRVGGPDDFGREEDSDSDEDDRWLDEEHGAGGDLQQQNLGEGGGGDQAGVILGCHNIYIVLPQFLVTALSSIIFAILDPGKSVLGSHAPTSSSSPPRDSDEPTAGSPRHVFERLVMDGTRYVLARRDQLAGGPDASNHSQGYSSLSLIFQVGGIAALVSSYICFRLWRDTVHDARRITRSRAGYGRVQG